MRLDRENGRFLGVCAGVANWLDVPAVLVRIVFVICALTWPPLIIAYFVIYFCVDKDFTPAQIRDYFSDTETASHFRRIDYRKPIYRNLDNKRVAGVCSGIADYLEVSSFSVRIVTLLSFFLTGPFTFWAYIIAWFVIEPDPACVNSGGSRSRRRAARREKYEARRKRRAERRHARMRSKNKIYKGFARKSYRNDEEIVNEFENSADYEQAQSEAEPQERASSHAASHTFSRKECTRLYGELEQRLRGIEAFMTSKRFRLHCEINRI